MKKTLPFAIFIIFFAACNNGSSEPPEPIESSIPAPVDINYKIVASYPHDTSSYTQGLVWQNNSLYEGTGLEGHSRLMKVSLKDGHVNESVSLAPEIFGEGITMFNNKIYQLTWQNHKVFVYDATTLKKLNEYEWPHDGWGLTNNGSDLIVSTGESNLYFVDPATFKVKRFIVAMDNNGPVGNLNELEYIDGAIYANIYLTDDIIKIDPVNGHILGKMELDNLLEKNGKSVDKDQGLVLNGIAFDSTKKTMYITGKKWPLLFEMKLN